MSSSLRIYRPARSTYLVFGLIWCVLFAIMVAAVIKRPSEPSAWQFLAILVGVGGLLCVWISAFKLELDRTTIAYRSLFGGHHRVNLSDVAVATAATGSAKFSEPLLPPNRIEIIMKRGTKPVRLIINAKVFSRRAIADLRQELAPVWRASAKGRLGIVRLTWQRRWLAASGTACNASREPTGQARSNDSTRRLR
jgi:hypothetical protein